MSSERSPANIDDGTEASVLAPVGRPYHTKRPHRKSRAGCRNCKTRKVKCDEAKPTCRACSLRKEQCEYPPRPTVPAHQHHRDHSSPEPPSVDRPVTPILSIGTVQFGASPAEQASSRVNLDFEVIPTVASNDESIRSTRALVLPLHREPLFRPVIPGAGADADETEMRLLWFYTANTHGSFSSPLAQSSRVNEVLRTNVVQYAFGSKFLMQTLLALSALHLQYLKYDEALRIPATTAIYYRASAFAGYRKAIEAAHPDSYPALLATSLLLCAVASQGFREPDAPPRYILEYMVVWRGIGLIMDIISPHTLDNSGVGALFYRPPVDPDAAASHIPSNLLFMISTIQPGDADYPYVQTYHDALKQLGALYQELKTGFSYTLDLRIIVFFTFVPKAFIDLCRERRPRALAILMYWLSFARLVRSIWWMEGIGEQALPHVAEILGPEWSSVIRVPLVAASLSSKVDVARALLESHGWDIHEHPLSHNLDADPADICGKSIAKQDLVTSDGEFRFPANTIVTMRPRPIDESTLYEAISKSTPSSVESHSTPSSGIFNEDMFDDLF